MAKQKKYHFIYKTTCVVTGKFYVGMHSTDNLDDGYLGSGKILGYSRKKYGDENHKLEILEHCNSRDELKIREKELVNEELLNDPLNINLKYGGEGGWDHARVWSDERKQRRSELLKDVWKRPDYRALQKAHQSKNMKSLHAAGKLRYDTFRGKHLSEEHKKKIGKANSLTQAGENNSQFGTCWVTDGIKPIKIKKDRLDEFLNDGYRRGRK